MSKKLLVLIALASGIVLNLNAYSATEDGQSCKGIYCTGVTKKPYRRWR